MFYGLMNEVKIVSILCLIKVLKKLIFLFVITHKKNIFFMMNIKLISLKYCYVIRSKSR